MNIKWNKAPVKTVWGDDMVVASVAIDNDHTVDFYCERDQTDKVEAMFAPQRKPLTDEELFKLWDEDMSCDMPDMFTQFKHTAQAIEAKLKEKNT